MSRRDFFQFFCMFYLRLINRKCAKEKKQQYLMLYQTWNRTSVYFKLAVRSSYFVQKFGQKRPIKPSQRSQENTAAYMEYQPPTRWSRQRANDRYKDHLDGQLTRGLPTLSLWGPHIRWLEEPRACNQFLGSGSGVTYKQASDHSILPLVSKCWQYCFCKRKRNTFKIKTLIGPKFMSVVS